MPAPTGTSGRARRRRRRATTSPWSTPRPAPSARRPGSTSAAGCSTPRRRSASWSGRNLGGRFEGYYDNAEAEAERTRNGWYWSGDLVYRDEDGVFYFAGRSGDWLRVDSENFAAAPIERILQRWEPVTGRRRLPGARQPHRRPGDGRDRARGPAPRSTPTPSPRSWPTSPTSAPSGRRATCASSTPLPVTGNREDRQAAAASRSAGRPTTRSGTAPPHRHLRPVHRRRPRRAPPSSRPPAGPPSSGPDAAPGLGRRHRGAQVPEPDAGGGQSSFRMVPVPLATAMVARTGAESVTRNVWLGSAA